jgi:uncharacterized protein (UPF0276 family)
MKLAVNFSRPLAALVASGDVRVDLYKCPAWANIVAEIGAAHPAYVHFPLKVGLGIHTALDTETRTTVEWTPKVDVLRARTETPFINLHLNVSTADYPDIPLDSADPAHVDRLVQRALQDVQAVIARYGPDRVIVENDHDSGEQHLRAGYLPEMLHRIVEETGCGLLLDISHAVLAANRLGLNVREYLAALPVRHIREIHVTGVDRIDAGWQKQLRQVGVDEPTIKRFAGRLQDHLPMTDADWDLLAWVLDNIRRGDWGTPWAVAFEYGGIGPLWESITDADVLAAQVPRLTAMVHGD